jgi:lysophospholipase L1-like esterase
MKKMWLIGDSIRIGYQPFVQSGMDGIAAVAGPEDNCRFSKYTLWYVDIWLNEFGRPDLIHWNNGMWDVYRHEGDNSPFESLDGYIANMRQIYEKLKKYGVPIIYATTTPVKPDHPNCRNELIDQYNDAIVAMLRAEGVAINDLNAVIRTKMNDYISEDGMHLTEEGSKACSQAVTDIAKAYFKAERTV